MPDDEGCSYWISQRFINWRIYIDSLQILIKTWKRTSNTIWFQKLRNFKVGDLLSIASDDTSRSSWPLGHIIEVFVWSNDIVRTVKLKTGSGEILRPASQLALLEATCDWLNLLTYGRSRYQYSHWEGKMFSHSWTVWLLSLCLESVKQP